MLQIIKTAQLYTMADGEMFAAETATELLHKMRADSFNPEATLDAYIEATAQAATTYNGKPHRGDTADNLLFDLLSSGLIIMNANKG